MLEKIKQIILIYGQQSHGNLQLKRFWKIQHAYCIYRTALQ